MSSKEMFAPVISPSTEVEAKSPIWRNVIAANCFCILGDNLVDDAGGLLYTGKQTISLTIEIILTKNLLYIGKHQPAQGLDQERRRYRVLLRLFGKPDQGRGSGSPVFSVTRRSRSDSVSESVSESLTLRTELTDVILVSEDTY